MKKNIFLFIAILCSFPGFSQTLFSFGTHTVSKQEFLQAFQKNIPFHADSLPQAFENYLNLYIQFKLKLQAAYDDKLNESESFKLEADNFKKELAEKKINEEAGFQQLFKEVIQRGATDIAIAQIFIATPLPSDTIKTFREIQQAYTFLQQGKSFETVAQQFCTDSLLGNKKGYIGYITVFTLPYEIENIVYALHANEYSKPYRSKLGYHIFKKIEERAAMGTKRVQQILLAVPQSFSFEEKQQIKHLADSIYNLLQQGISFVQLQQQYSSVPVNIYAPQSYTEVRVGEYVPEFEEQVYALQKPGDITKPFFTKYGYHIVKLIGTASETENIASWQRLVEESMRLYNAKKKLLPVWLKKCGYKPVGIQKNNWLTYTTQLFSEKNNLKTLSYNPQQVLFSFAKKNIIMQQWIDFVTNVHQTKNEKAQLSYDSLMKEWIGLQCGIYYREHIEDFYSDVADALKEFKEANLIFAVMDKNVWAPSADSVKLRQFFNKHQQQYAGKNWEEVKGWVMNSYQQSLEEAWLEELKKKYPVQINAKVKKECLESFY